MYFRRISVREKNLRGKEATSGNDIETISYASPLILPFTREGRTKGFDYVDNL